MADLAYREVHTMSRIEARPRLVTTCHETGSIRQRARQARGWLPSLDLAQPHPPCSAAG